MSEDKYLTRAEGAAFIKAELGIPISLSTLNKDVALKVGPIADARCGNKDLYFPETMRRYARARLVNKRTPDSEGSSAA